MAALAWAAELPPHLDTVVILWWVATGEITPPADPPADLAALPPEVRAELPSRW